MITCLPVFPGLSLELVTHWVAINMSSQYSNHSQKKKKLLMMAITVFVDHEPVQKQKGYIYLLPWDGYTLPLKISSDMQSP